LPRNQFIDVLRGISISLVLLHHFNIAYSLQNTALAHLLGWPLLHAVLRNGNYGVTMFFVISGFLITSNAKARFANLRSVGLGAFYRYRAARILPSVVLLVFVVNVFAWCRIGIFLNHPDDGSALPFWLGDLASLTFWMNVLMARAGWFNYVLCVLWSLSVEEVFYVGFPILCRVLKRERYLVVAWLVFIVAGPIWRATHQDDENAYLFAYLACFDGIAIGCCAALLRPRLYFGSAGLVCCVYLGWSIGSANTLGVTLVAAGTATMILGHRPVGLDAIFICRSLSHGFAWAGRLSLESYLFHLLVLAAMKSLWDEKTLSGDGKMALLLAYVVVSGLITFLISHFYAGPLNRLFRVRPTA
jgi:peptidoglycan/LPS O-acetylase OafA/YrhL